LLTVSEYGLRGAEGERALRRWVAETTAFHAGIGITGGLVLARDLLAEIIEGEAEAIERSLRRTMAANHHAGVTIVDSLTTRARAFEGWTLLYEGPASYVSGPIRALLDAPDAFHSNRLRCLMKALADTAEAPGAAAWARAGGPRSCSEPRGDTPSVRDVH